MGFGLELHPTGRQPHDLAVHGVLYPVLFWRIMRWIVFLWGFGFVLYFRAQGGSTGAARANFLTESEQLKVGDFFGLVCQKFINSLVNSVILD